MSNSCLWLIDYLVLFQNKSLLYLRNISFFFPIFLFSLFHLKTLSFDYSSLPLFHLHFQEYKNHVPNTKRHFKNQTIHKKKKNCAISYLKLDFLTHPPCSLARGARARESSQSAAYITPWCLAHMQRQALRPAVTCEHIYIYETVRQQYERSSPEYWIINQVG